MSFLIKNIPFLFLAWIIYSLFEEYGVRNEQITLLETQEKPKIEKNIKELRNALKKSKAIEGQIESFRVRIKEVSDQIAEVQKQLPETIIETDILDMFAKETNLLNIKDVTFSPGEEIPKDFYVTKRYNIKGRGTHLQFLVFFERLRKKERIYNVENIKVSTPADQSKGRFHLVDLEATIEAYRYNANHNESLDKLEKEAVEEIEIAKKSAKLKGKVVTKPRKVKNSKKKGGEEDV